MKKTILFITKPLIVEPLGIMYLSAAAKSQGHIVHLTHNPDDAIKIRPDYIGYSVMTGDQNHFMNINRWLKRRLNFKSVFGGPHPSFFPEDMDDVDVDYICRGEGEQFIIDLLNTGNVEKSYPLSDVNKLAWADRTLFNSEIRYFLSSRGCPFNCTYCYNKKWFNLHENNGNSRVRLRDPKDLVDEIVAISPEFVYFQDDNFGIDIDWLKEFNEIYPKIPFHCHLRPNLVTEQRVFWIKECGAYSIRAAVETANNSLRNAVLQRNISRNQIETSVALFKKHGLKFMLQNMIGIPSGTIEDDLETLKMNVDLQPTYAWVSILQPYPGTVLGDYCIKNDYYTGDFSDISPSFRDKTVLNFSDEYKEQIEVLQKIFGLYVEAKMMPEISDLKRDNLPNMVYNAMRRIGDRKLYGEVVDKWKDM